MGNIEFRIQVRSWQQTKQHGPSFHQRGLGFAGFRVWGLECSGFRDFDEFGGVRSWIAARAAGVVSARYVKKKARERGQGSAHNGDPAVSSFVFRMRGFSFI